MKKVCIQQVTLTYLKKLLWKFKHKEGKRGSTYFPTDESR